MAKKYLPFAGCGVRTHALIRVSELKSDALDRSANPAACEDERIFKITKPFN